MTDIFDELEGIISDIENKNVGPSDINTLRRVRNEVVQLQDALRMIWSLRSQGASTNALYETYRHAIDSAVEADPFKVTSKHECTHPHAARQVDEVFCPDCGFRCDHTDPDAPEC